MGQNGANIRTMRLLRVLAVLGLCGACRSGTEPPTPPAIVGSYRLVSVNGQALPFTESATSQLTASGLTIASDYGWTVVDTSAGTFYAGGTFRWTGVAVPDQANVAHFAFQDSLRLSTRYTGTINADTFTLVSTRTYRYVRK